jgi:hypothetical protein
MGSWVLRVTGISGIVDSVRERRERWRQRRDYWKAHQEDYKIAFMAGAGAASAVWIFAIAAMLGAAQEMLEAFFELPKAFLNGLLTLL